MQVAQKSPANGARLVVTLAPREQRKLKKFAAEEQVSSSEIISRSLAAYEPLEARARREEKERLAEAMLRQISQAYREVNSSLQQTFDELELLHLQLKSRDVK